MKILKNLLNLFMSPSDVTIVYACFGGGHSRLFRRFRGQEGKRESLLRHAERRIDLRGSASH